MCFFCFKQKTAYEMRISDWSSDVCSSELDRGEASARRSGLSGLLELGAGERAGAASVREADGADAAADPARTRSARRAGGVGFAATSPVGGGWSYSQPMRLKRQ